MFSVGILYAAQEFLEFVSKSPVLDLSFPDVFSTFSVASPRAVLELSQKCEWVRLNVTGKLEITERGLQVLQGKYPEFILRIQIGHLIESYLPPWIPLLSRGRQEAQRYFPADVRQCFREANLFSEPTDEIVSWWDKYSKISRKTRRDSNLETGRRGEKLSIEHERWRTQREPFWQGLESNLAGYDVLSVVDAEDVRPLRIEVKTSNSVREVASFYLSRNEWQVATTSDNYVLHLWALQPKPFLTIISFSQLQDHVPTNQGDGMWESVSIPFSAFI
jgi:hypothetical protein